MTSRSDQSANPIGGGNGGPKCPAKTQRSEPGGHPPLIIGRRLSTTATHRASPSFEGRASPPSGLRSVPPGISPERFAACVQVLRHGTAPWAGPRSTGASREPLNPPEDLPKRARRHAERSRGQTRRSRGFELIASATITIVTVTRRAVETAG